MRLNCNSCGKTLTNDLRPVRGLECVSVEGEFEYNQIPVGGFIRGREVPAWNHSWCKEVPTKLIPKSQAHLSVGVLDILDGIIPPFKSGYGCCNWSGVGLQCSCGSKLGEMYLDCHESKYVDFYEKNVRRVYVSK